MIAASLVPNFTEARVTSSWDFGVNYLPTISDTRASAILGTARSPAAIVKLCEGRGVKLGGCRAGSKLRAKACKVDQ